MEPLPESNRRVFQISPNIAAKYACNYDELYAESLAMMVVAERTSILVPQVLGVEKLKQHSFNAVLVMELIPKARRLVDCWESLSLWRKIIVVLTLRSYLRQLRNIDLPERDRPGPIGPKLLRSRGFALGFEATDRFRTRARLVKRLDEYHKMAKHDDPTMRMRRIPRSALKRLVFTHGDLNLRNILLDSNDQVWLVDWGFSGYYPPFFEYVNMRAAAVGTRAPKSFQAVINYLTNPEEGIWEWVNECVFPYDLAAESDYGG